MMACKSLNDEGNVPSTSFQFLKKGLFIKIHHVRTCIPLINGSTKSRQPRLAGIIIPAASDISLNKLFIMRCNRFCHNQKFLFRANVRNFLTNSNVHRRKNSRNFTAVKISTAAKRRDSSSNIKPQITEIICYFLDTCALSSIS